jgi:hypothetical protein
MSLILLTIDIEENFARAISVLFLEIFERGRYVNVSHFSEYFDCGRHAVAAIPDPFAIFVMPKITAFWPLKPITKFSPPVMFSCHYLQFCSLPNSLGYRHPRIKVC